MVSAVVVQYVLSLAIAYLVTHFFTPKVAHLAIRCGLVDRPGARRVHDRPTPVAGGLSVFIGFFFAWMLLALLNRLIPSFGLQLPNGSALFGAASFLVLVGLLDDRFGISPLSKLFGQTISALILFSGGYSIAVACGIHVPFLIDLALTVLWLLAIVNSLNLIDGMDGLASGIATLAAVGIACAFSLSGNPNGAVILAALAGSTLGFLRFNRHPASIFLGDTGSMLLGLLLGALPLLLSWGRPDPLPSVVVPLLALAIPLADTILAIWRRCMRIVVAGLLGRPRPRGFMSADMDHIHHRLLRSGLGQQKVCAVLYTASGTLAGVGIIATASPALRLPLLLGTALCGGYIILRHVATLELWESGLAIVHGLRYRRKPKAAAAALIAIDGLCLILAMALTIVLIPPHPEGFVTLRLVGLQLTVFCLTGVVALWVFRLRKNGWFLEPGSASSAQVLMLLVIGGFLSACLAGLADDRFSPVFWTGRTLMFTAVAAALHSFSQLLPHLVERSIRKRLHDEVHAAACGFAVPAPFEPIGEGRLVLAFDALITVVEATMTKQRTILAAVFPPRAAASLNGQADAAGDIKAVVPPEPVSPPAGPLL